MELPEIAKEVAKEYGLDPALVCAVCEQESSWNPWAIRYEPAFFTRYVSPLLNEHKITPTEAYARATSWGLMQVMGQTAREGGSRAKFLSALCEPYAGINVGCQVLKGKLERAKGDVRQALLYYNGGGNKDYPDQVMARMEKYR